jgi:hypothetical protein
MGHLRKRPGFSGRAGAAVARAFPESGRTVPPPNLTFSIERTAGWRPAFSFRLRSGLNAVAQAPICGQQIGQMAI